MRPVVIFLLPLMILCYGCKHNDVTPKTTVTQISFQTDVLPIFTTHCALSGCHDATTARLGVILDSYAHIMQGIVAYKPDSSHYYTIVQLGAMPPASSGKPKMTDGQIDTIAMWINQGAKD